MKSQKPFVDGHHRGELDRLVRGRDRVFDDGDEVLEDPGVVDGAHHPAQGVRGLGVVVGGHLARLNEGLFFKDSKENPECGMRR